MARIEFVALARLFWLALEIRNLLALALLKEDGRTLFGKAVVELICSEIPRKGEQTPFPAIVILLVILIKLIIQP